MTLFQGSVPFELFDFRAGSKCSLNLSRTSLLDLQDETCTLKGTLGPLGPGGPVVEV